jgi:hypothetical protein
MFGLKVQDWLKKEEWDLNENLKMVVLLCLFLVPLLILSVAGTMSSFNEDGTTSGPYPQCLYIGLPILFGVYSPIALNFIFKPSKNLFNKAGFVWKKCPYIFWIIKGCIESIAAGFLPILFVPIIIVKYIGIPIGIGFIKTIQTIGVICTIPDGKAEAKIKQIWSGK